MKKLLKKTLFLSTLAVTLTLIFSVCARATDHVHDYSQLITPATLLEDGHITKKCDICGYTIEGRNIPKIATVKLEKSKFVYNGDYVFPKVIIKDAEGNIIESYDYTFSYKSANKIGTYTATVTFNDYYKGTVKLTYKIVSPISAPELKAATSTTKGAKIEWENQKKATGYIVYRKSGNGDWKKLGTTKKTYYVDSTAVYNKTYKYTVKAYYKPEVPNKNITSGYDKKGLTLKMTKVVTPSAPTVTSKSLYASIKIKEVKGATSYKIYKSTSKDGKYKLIHTTKKGVLSYTDKSVKINKTYYYKVRAYAGSKASSLSACDKVLIKLDTPKINKTVNVTSSTVTFKWNKVKGATHYKIYHRSNNWNEWKAVKTVKAGDTLTYKNKFPAELNQFSVVAFKKLSSKTTLKSSRSASLGANPIAKPKITVEYPNATDLQIILNINVGSRPQYYTVYCKEGKNGSWKVAKNAYKNFTGSIYRQDVKLNTPYYFAVKSYYKSDGFTVYGPTSETTSVMLHYNPDVEVILPKESTKEGALFPVTVKNNSASTLRLYPDAYIENSDISKCGDITVYDFYGEYINENGYIDIAPYSSVTVSFGRKRNDAQYNRKCSVIFKFRQNGADYYSSYSNYYGESFKLNKE